MNCAVGLYCEIGISHKYKQTRWLHCVECPQYSTRRKSACLSVRVI